MRRMLVLVAVSLVLIAATDGFRYSECEHVTSPVLSLNSLVINPTTVTIPGDLSLTFQATIHRSITKDLRVDLTMKKKTFIGDIRVPCLFKMGSCSYNACDELSMLYETEHVQCPLKQEDSNSNCTCPFQPGSYEVTKGTFHIPKIAAVLGFMVSGTYKIKAQLIDTVTNHVVGCYDIEISVNA